MKIHLWNPLVLFQRKDLDWCGNISTESPICTYYFGPFDNDAEAKLHQGGYIEDLTLEGAQHIAVEVKRANPAVLTT